MNVQAYTVAIVKHLQTRINELCAEKDINDICEMLLDTVGLPPDMDLVALEKIFPQTLEQFQEEFGTLKRF